MKRAYRDPPDSERCAQTITLRDGTQARCGRRFVDKGPWCRQHRQQMIDSGLVRANAPATPPLHDAVMDANRRAQSLGRARRRKKT